MNEDGNRLSVYGSNCADVGETAFRHSILVHQLADEVGDAGPAVSVPARARTEEVREVEPAAPQMAVVDASSVADEPPPAMEPSEEEAAAPMAPTQAHAPSAQEPPHSTGTFVVLRADADLGGASSAAPAPPRDERAAQAPRTPSIPVPARPPAPLSPSRPPSRSTPHPARSVRCVTRSAGRPASPPVTSPRLPSSSPPRSSPYCSRGPVNPRRRTCWPPGPRGYRFRRLPWVRGCSGPSRSATSSVTPRSPPTVAPSPVAWGFFARNSLSQRPSPSRWPSSSSPPTRCCSTLYTEKSSPRFPPTGFRRARVGWRSSWAAPGQGCWPPVSFGPRRPGWPPYSPFRSSSCRSYRRPWKDHLCERRRDFRRGFVIWPSCTGRSGRSVFWPRDCA